MEFLNVSEEFYNSETMGLDKQRGTITYSIARNLLANGMIDQITDLEKLKKYIIYSVLPHRICFKTTEQKLYDVVEEVWDKESIQQLKTLMFSIYHAGKNYRRADNRKAS